MNVKILAVTPKPLDVLYRAFKICVSSKTPTEIKIPEHDFYPEGAIEPLCKVSDNKKITEFIKKHINHESVLEHVNITFAIEGVSRSLSHQLVRHRVASYSQQSQRYVKLGQFEYVTPESIKSIDEKIRFGTNDIPQIEFKNCLEMYKNTMESLQVIYRSLIDFGVPQEDARYVLPNATTTNLIMTMNLREFRHFYSERSCTHAQWEIRELANKAMGEVKAIIPFAGYKAKKCGITCFECQQESKTVNLNHITIDCRGEN